MLMTKRPSAERGSQMKLPFQLGAGAHLLVAIDLSLKQTQLAHSIPFFACLGSRGCLPPGQRSGSQISNLRAQRSTDRMSNSRPQRPCRGWKAGYCKPLHSFSVSLTCPHVLLQGGQHTGHLSSCRGQLQIRGRGIRQVSTRRAGGARPGNCKLALMSRADPHPRRLLQQHQLFRAAVYDAFMQVMQHARAVHLHSRDPPKQQQSVLGKDQDTGRAQR